MYSWKNNKLYNGTKNTKFSLEEHSEYKNMYFIKFPDGSLSEDFYNISWGKQNARLLQQRI
jgi:hypothetical protein